MVTNNQSKNKVKVNGQDKNIKPDIASKVKNLTVPLNYLPEDDQDLSKSKLPNYVIGIGASAGGVEAIEALFSNMPLKTDMAFIVVQHLSADYKSMMPDLLAQKTKIPIKVAVDNMLIEADIIYLLPPKKEMITANARLYLTSRERRKNVNSPINTFFSSLAEVYQEKSIAIVLSGSGSDGSKGVVKVHDSGGFVVAQEPESCLFHFMPENAIKTNKVDLVCSPQNIPTALIKYTQSAINAEQQLNLGSLDAGVSPFSEILLLLNNRFDLDFSQYKASNITRKLEQRMSYQKSTSLKDYSNVLIANKDELETLYDDILTGFTAFCSDNGSYVPLRTLIPKLLSEFKRESEIRIWIPACACGLEAYSMAMMITDIMEKDPHGDKPFKMFATDIHNKSIQIATAGIYDEAAIQSIDIEYRWRFFTKLPSGDYQIVPDIAKSIVFVQHNLLKDPPFKGIHLVSCRNLLIYLHTSAQQRMLSLLSFSLMEQGILLIGPSETIGSHSDDFEIIDGVHRLFRRTCKTLMPSGVPLILRNRTTIKAISANAEVGIDPKSKKALEMLLQKHVPTSLLVDDNGQILHVFGDAGKYLTINFGSASLNITALVGDEAKAILSEMLQRMRKHCKPIKAKAIKGFNQCAAVDVEMSVLSESSGDVDGIIISLSETGDVRNAYSEEASLVDVTSLEQTFPFENIKINELEEALIFSQESLQTTVIALQKSHEALQASNQQLMASNEEKESVNEALFSVNTEFQQKEREREELRSDERSIVEESNLGILFLDENLKIRKFSPSAGDLFGLTENDYGRPLIAASGSIVQKIQGYVHEVFHGGELIEQEVEDEHGLIYLVRINAYISNVEEGGDSNVHKNKGVVITLTNVSKLYATTKSLEKSQNLFNNVLNAISDGYFEWILETDNIFFSPSFYQKLGYGDNRPNLDSLLGKHAEVLKLKLHQTQLSGLKIEEPLPFVTAKGDLHWMIFKGEFQVDEQRQHSKLIGITIDFSAQKAVENTLQDQAVELERSNQLLEKFAYIVSHDIKAPIRHIQNYLMFLKEAIESQDEQAIKEEMQGIEKSAAVLTVLVDDVITYARVTSEKKKMSDVNINDVLDYIIYIMSPIIKSKNIKIERDDIPSIKGDKTLLTHLLQNLISNACKYNDKTHPLITVTYSVVKKNHIITVTDNGIGFDQANANKIFDPFNRLVTKDQFEGSGIGLSICKTAVEQHKGSIRAESKIGEGASFTVTLPL